MSKKLNNQGMAHLVLVLVAVVVLVAGTFYQLVLPNMLASSYAKDVKTKRDAYASAMDELKKSITAEESNSEMYKTNRDATKAKINDLRKRSDDLVKLPVAGYVGKYKTMKDNKQKMSTSLTEVEKVISQYDIAINFVAAFESFIATSEDLSASPSLSGVTQLGKDLSDISSSAKELSKNETISEDLSSTLTEISEASDGLDAMLDQVTEDPSLVEGDGQAIFEQAGEEFAQILTGLDTTELEKVYTNQDSTYYQKLVSADQAVRDLKY